MVGFAKDVKDGRRQPLSKEENARGGQQDKEAEQRRKKKGKGVVSQAKIVFETKEGSKVGEEAGTGGQSRGYGFIEYSSHRWALMGLRWLNGHELKNATGKATRLIVEFAIENVNVVTRRKANEERARTHEPRPNGVTAAMKGRGGGDPIRPSRRGGGDPIKPGRRGAGRPEKGTENQERGPGGSHPGRWGG